MKKLVSFIIALALALCPLYASAATADEFDPASVSTPYVCLIDAGSGAVLYEKNSHEQAYPASTTKIMTCILAIEMCEDINETVTVGENVETRGSVINIVRNEQMPLIDLLYGMMLESGNDAAKAIAEHFAQSESAFAELMTQKAQSLGMTDTHFTKANGLHKEDHYTTAYDMAILARYAMQNETFRKIVSTETYDAAPTNKDSDGYHWENTNKLIHTKEGKDSFEYQYANGIKTGDTDNAGRCLVASAKKGDVELILVLFGDYSNKVSADYRFENAAKFFEWGFSNFATINASSLGLESTLQASVSGAAADDPEGGLLTLNIDLESVTVSSLKSTIEKIQSDPSLLTQSKAINNLTAPVAAGDECGLVSYQYDGSTIFTAKVYASRDVAAASNEPVSQPSSSPLALETADPGSSDNGGSTIVFWLCLVIALLIIVLIAKIISSKRRKRRVARRRRAYRSKLR